MHNFAQIAVVNVWVVCVWFGAYCTVPYKSNVRLCSNGLFVLIANTFKTQAYPHAFSDFNSLVSGLTHITHRTYKNKDYLYKYIITNTMENL